jgi:hypothetical protein
MAKGDSSVNSKGPRVKAGGRRPPHEDMLFGTDQEINDRDPNTSLYDQYGLSNTQPPHFQQISPESSTGKSVNKAPLGHKSGDFKVSGGIGKP